MADLSVGVRGQGLAGGGRGELAAQIATMRTIAWATKEGAGSIGTLAGSARSVAQTVAKFQPQFSKFYADALGTLKDSDAKMLRYQARNSEIYQRETARMAGQDGAGGYNIGNTGMPMDALTGLANKQWMEVTNVNAAVTDILSVSGNALKLPYIGNILQGTYLLGSDARVLSGISKSGEDTGFLTKEAEKLGGDSKRYAALQKMMTDYAQDLGGTSGDPMNDVRGTGKSKGPEPFTRMPSRIDDTNDRFGGQGTSTPAPKTPPPSEKKK